MTRTLAFLAALAVGFAVVPSAGAARSPLDTRYARAFKAAWNRVDPHAPILELACIPTTRAKVGMPGAGPIEDCLIVERAPMKRRPRAVLCTGAYLDPTVKDPLEAVDDAVLVSCGQARREISAVERAARVAAHPGLAA